MSYFKERKENLKLKVDPCATAVDVNTAELPSTPCLIIQGDMMKPSGWLISIEGHVVMGPHPLFLHRVAAFFSSYYVFNLEYPAAGSSTLESIQRCFLGINPERGSKNGTTLHYKIFAQRCYVWTHYRMFETERSA
ncbi:hypothetical protein PBY51_016968 [Eleginops maclovinus]|uniref:Uncharacterized protein n=1 Tax=Eleginops maclovinus TaxID=56733 RepID=A0AAN8A9A4_ELEMC|nr:hypothetical protein PBY51_016968 [Eleginops maclovinus]